VLSVSSNFVRVNNFPVRFKGGSSSELVKKGDDLLNSNKADEALASYREAQTSSPDDVEISRKIAKAYFKLKDYKSAAENYEKYLETSPYDVDCLIDLGEAQRMGGYYQKSINTFQKACELDSSNDLASRSLMEAKNNLLSVYNLQRAVDEKNAYASQNLKAALDMTVGFMGADYMADLNDIKVEFGKTAEMGGTANIAQYENAKKSITISNSYVYAAPQVIAAYLSHETVHAKDKDPYTSIREEQDAYTVAAKFWLKNSNGVKDPEMDYAVGLYKQSPSALNQRVAQIYKLRDPSIEETSPNHPPQRKFSFFNKAKKAASQPIKQYDTIA